MTPSRKEELRRLEAAATGGPWTVCAPCDAPGRSTCGIVWANDGETTPCLISDECTDTKRSNEQRQHDGRFIAAARQAVPELLAELDAAERERDEARRTLDALTTCVRCECVLHLPEEAPYCEQGCEADDDDAVEERKDAYRATIATWPEEEETERT